MEWAALCRPRSKEVKSISVIKAKRKPSSVQFIQTALDLSIYTIQRVRKFPKALTFFVSVPTVNAAKSMYANVKRANSIYPTSKHELDLRIGYFKSAYADLQVLSTEVDIAVSIQGHNLTENVIIDWYRLIDDEMNLLKAQIKNDKARFKNLS